MMTAKAAMWSRLMAYWLTPPPTPPDCHLPTCKRCCRTQGCGWPDNAH